MKTITKTLFFAMVLLMSVSLVAQKSFLNNTGNTPPDKQELIQQLHGPTFFVPTSPIAGKAVGDDCNTPLVITIDDANDLPYSGISSTTVGSGNNYSNTCLNDFDGGSDFIYQIDLATDMTLNFKLDPSGTAYTGFALNEQCFDDPTATCLGVSTDTYGTGEAHGFAIALEAGTYYVMVDSWPDGVKTSEIPEFYLTITEATPVPNDDCANAIEIGEVNNLYFSTEEATESTWPGGYIDIFYNYTATFTGDVVVSLCDTYFDTELRIYDDCNGNLIDSNDDAGCGFEETGSLITMSVVQGENYIIMVTGYLGEDTGYGFLNIYEDNSGCDLTLTPGITDENEPCPTNVNGSCDLATTVAGGDTIFGNTWADDGARDTDWFEITIADVSNIKLAVIGEEPLVFGMVAQVEQGVAGCDNLLDYFVGFKQIPACIEDSIEFGYLPAGTYYFMVTSQSYYNYACPGFDYQAAFTVDANATGTISGTVNDGTKAGVENVVVTADVYSTTTAADGTYSMDVPPGDYDVYFDGMGVGFGSKMVSGQTVTEGNTTTVDATLSDAAPVLTAASAVDYSWAKLSWTFDKNANGTDVVMGGVEVNNTYTPGATEDINFTLTIYAPFPDDPDDVEYFEITLPDVFTINTASDFPDDNYNSSVTADIIGQTVSWETNYDYLWYQSFITYDFTINVSTTAGPGGASGPQICDYLLSGDGYTGYPDYFDGLVTIFEEGGSYVPTYNVYRKLDDNTGNVFIPLVKDILDTELYDVLNYNGSIIGGNWCYFVTTTMEDGTESAPSNEVCVEVKEPCGDAIDYGSPGDAAQTATLDYTDQIVWFTFTTPGGDIQISTCGSDFDTQFALYSSCDDVPIYPDMVPDGAVETATEGCNDIGQATLALCSLEGGTYYLAVYGENDATGEIELEITKDFQCLTIYNGWGGFSTFIEPSPNDSIQVVLADMEEEMEIAIRQNPYGIWWVPENINTIGKITPVIGYKSKMNGTETTIVTGTEIANKTVNIPKGASYLPVRVPYPTDISELETQLGAELLILYNIYNPAEVLWPDGSLSTLPQLLPDYAYQINVYNATSFTYPSSKTANLNTYTIPEHTFYKGANVAWNEVVNTGNPHFISIKPDAMSEIMAGDMIGVFNSEGTCVGFVEVDNTTETNLLNAFGDDAYTVDLMDGLEEGEMMNFKLFRPSTEQEYALEVTWNTAMPSNDGLFAVNGLSMISNLKVGPTDISESEFANVSIYPNPTSGVISINGINGDANVSVTNAQGQLIYNATLINNRLDMSNQPKGIYFIRISNNDETMIQKVILK